VAIYSTAREFLDSCKSGSPPDRDGAGAGAGAATPTPTQPPRSGGGRGGGSRRAPPRRTVPAKGGADAKPSYEDVYGGGAAAPAPPRGSSGGGGPGGSRGGGRGEGGGRRVTERGTPRRGPPAAAKRGAPRANTPDGGGAKRGTRFGALVVPASDAATPGGRKESEASRPEPVTARRPASDSKGRVRPSSFKKARRPQPRGGDASPSPPGPAPRSLGDDGGAPPSREAAAPAETPAPAPPRADAADGADDDAGFVVRDESKAAKNDAILAQALAEAGGRRQARSARHGGGAPQLFQFPLWAPPRAGGDDARAAPDWAARAPRAGGEDPPAMPDWAKASLARGATIFFPDGAPGDASAPRDALKAPRPYEFPLWKKPAQPDDAPTVATGGLSTGGTVATGGLSTGGAPPGDDAAAAEVADDCSVGSERSAALSEAGSVSTVATALPVAPIAVDLATSGTYRPEPAADDARATAAVSPDRDADSVRTFDSPAVLRGPAPSASPQHRAPDADAPPRPAVARQLSASLPARPRSLHPSVALNAPRKERKAGAWDQATPRPPPEAVATPQPMHWRRGEQLGEGTFGKVYLALNERNGELFACKRIGLAPDAGAAELHELESEIRLLKTIDHKHVVRYLGTELRRSEGLMYLFLEYVPGGSIASMLAQFGVFSEVLIRIYVTQILRGVRYLHDRKIVHRDIKGGNVLVNDSGVAKLADFGCSKQLQGMRTGTLEQSLQAIQGSVPWMAPEVIKQSGHGRGADVWSVGATVIEMATAKHPWPKFSNNLTALFQIATSTEPPPCPDSLSPAAKAFIDRCLQIDPKDRATAKELLADDFVMNSP